MTIPPKPERPKADPRRPRDPNQFVAGVASERNKRLTVDVSEELHRRAKAEALRKGSPWPTSSASF